MKYKNRSLRNWMQANLTEDQLDDLVSGIYDLTKGEINFLYNSFKDDVWEVIRQDGQGMEPFQAPALFFASAAFTEPGNALYIEDHDSMIKAVLCHAMTFHAENMESE